jgi:hypothetical protein
MRKLAPILLFTYNRVEHTRKTLEALSVNYLASESELIVISDAPKIKEHIEGVEIVRDLIRSKTWCKSTTLLCMEKNMGMNDNFLVNITAVVEKYGKVIVLEDDICTSPQFLTYMNDALEMYENEERVMQVSGFVFDISKRNLPPSFFVGITNGWGWATWKDKWNKLNRNAKELFDTVQKNNLYNRMTVDGAEPDFWNQLEANATGVHNDWDIKWFSSVVANNGLCLYPKESLVVNIGFDGTGTHFKNGEKGHKTVFSKSQLRLEKIPVEESLIARKSFAKYFKSQQPTFFDKAKYKLNLLKSKYFGK